MYRCLTLSDCSAGLAARSSPSSSQPALDGVFVLELVGSLAGVLAGMLLADNGARVVKVEPPAGSPERSRPGHRVWNRGKQSVLLDLERPSAWAAFERLLERADVVVWDSHAHPRVRVLGDGREVISAVYPRLITCEITGQIEVSDALIAARTGRCGDQSGWEPGPSHVVTPMPSVAAALLVLQGVTASLLVRSARGHGQHVRTSLLGGLLAVSGAVLTDGPQPERGLSPAPRGSAPFYAMYACGDGAWLQLGCLHGGFVRRAIDVLDEDGALGRLAIDPAFGDGVIIQSLEVRAAAYAALERAFVRRDRAEWLTALEAGDVPVALVQATEPFLDDPQARANGLAEVIDSMVGPILQAGAFVRLSATPARIGKGAPTLGQHQATLLAAAGSDG
jgi:crotonobetainyl-CoA:carnitine CoA-transferase CaiB-like acyl-CoA transferase